MSNLIESNYRMRRPFCPESLPKGVICCISYEKTRKYHSIWLVKSAETTKFVLKGLNSGLATTWVDLPRDTCVIPAHICPRKENNSKMKYFRVLLKPYTVSSTQLLIATLAKWTQTSRLSLLHA